MIIKHRINQYKSYLTELHHQFLMYKFFFLLCPALIFGINLNAQTPTYKLYFTNEAQTSPNEYEFDVYLLRTGATALEMATIQFGLGFDTSILNGGTPTASIVSGTSDFSMNFQPTNVQVGGPNYLVNTVTYRYFNCAARSAPGAGNGIFISDVTAGCVAPGMRLSRFRLTNSVPFAANSTCKHVWSDAVGSGRTNTQVNAYVAGINTNISTGVQTTSHFGFSDVGTCGQNISLNPSNPCAVFLATNTSPESCFGSGDGSVTVTLSGNGSSAIGTYSLDGGTSTAYTTNPFTVNGLSAGNHMISVTTNTPCSAGPGNFTISGPTSPSTSTTNETACDSYTWPTNGNTYTSSGSYTFIGTQGGCPHTYTLNLTINQSTNTTVSRAECNSYTWPATGTSYTNSGTYSYTGVNSSGCPLLATLHLRISNVNVTATPTTSIACFGDSASVLIAASGGISPYSGTGTFNQSAGTTLYNVIDSIGCAGSSVLSITQPAEISANISSTAANCGSADGTASVIASGGSGAYTYFWSNGQTGTSASGLSSGTHSITITDNTGCNKLFSFNVGGSGGQPDPAGPISGPAGACTSQSGIVYSITPIANALSYVWTLPSGVSGSSTTNSITLSFSPSYAGGFICVAPVNSCGQGTQSCYNIPLLTLRPSHPGLISGDPQPCGPNLFTYSIPAISNALSYIWTVSGPGVSIQSGQGSRTIQVSLPAGFGQGTISVKAQNCVGTTATRTLTITGIPTHSNALIGPAFVCAGTNNVSYSIGSVNGAGSSYVWSVRGDMSISSFSQGTCILNFGTHFTSGTLTLTTSGNCGTFSKSYVIRSVPSQPGLIFGPGNDLCGQTNINYSIDPIQGASSYVWTVPQGVNINSNIAVSITADFTAAFSGSGYICVAALNSCGTSLTRCYAVTSRPPSPSIISGQSNPCRTSTELYTASAVSGATGYVWSVTGGAALSSTGTSASIDFNSSVTSNAVISVSAENACGVGRPTKKNLVVNPACRLSGKEISEEFSMRLSPNPSTGMVNLFYNSDGEGRNIIRIKDLAGVIVYEKEVQLCGGINYQKLDLSHLAGGLYFVSRGSLTDRNQALRLIIEH
jgi:hypothetical protein